MPQDAIHRRGSAVGAILLVGLGVLLLYANLRGLNPWPLVSQWWPVLLILLGLGKLWDHFRQLAHPEASGTTWLSGGAIAVLVLVLLFGIALSHGVGARRERHQAESVDRQGAELVRVRIQMRAGELKLAGGAGKLLEADFDYSEAEGSPEVAYDVAGNQGRLSVRQASAGVHFGRTHNTWDMRLANDVPMELKIEMGAGQGRLRLGGLALNKLDIQMGAGELTADLGGDWKKDLDANIRGGVGSATIRLPKNVGVRVHAAGGIGSINAHGIEREGDAYVNEAYGKSAVTLRMSIEGGIGEINLVPAS
jgi:hypothetical protein